MARTTAKLEADFIKQRQSNDIKLTSFTPVPHNFETTNQKEFQPFQVKARPQTAKPKVDVKLAFRLKLLLGRGNQIGPDPLRY